MADNLITKDKLAKVISIDFASRLNESIKPLLDILGIVELETIKAGTNIKQYQITGTLESGDVAEGTEVPLSSYSEKVVNTIEAIIKKHRKATSEEAILSSGFERAVVKTDQKMIMDVANEIRKDFVTFVTSATEDAGNGKTIKASLAKLAGKLAETASKLGYEGVTTLYICNPTDVYDYLGDASTYNVESAFGFKYIRDFLGLGLVLLDGTVEAGTCYGTFTGNLRGFATDLGELNDGSSTDYAFDIDGIVGIAHEANRNNGSYITHVRTGIKFVPEYVNLLMKSAIVPAV